MLEQGTLVRFFYLWARQAEIGEEAGRKSRPACIVVRTPSSPASLFLFPVTSQQPDTSRIALPVSQIECRRAGLKFPSWIILDEYNHATSDKAYDFNSLQQIGSFSSAFLKQIASAIKQAAAAKRLRRVVR